MRRLAHACKAARTAARENLLLLGMVNPVLTTGRAATRFGARIALILLAISSPAATGLGTPEKLCEDASD
jgi:hypothetical protein